LDGTAKKNKSEKMEVPPLAPGMKDEGIRRKMYEKKQDTVSKATV